MNKLTALSLFSGAGGMDVGFKRAGVNIVFANDINSDAVATYRANHSSDVMVEGDIQDLLGSLSRFQGTDIVFGGPPCQGFSVAGKMNPDDERSKLIFTFLDVVERVRPRAFVMENVKALSVLDKWKPVREKYLAKAASLGYYVASFVLNACDYGVSQKRERVFFIGIRDENPRFASIMANLLEQNKSRALTIRELLKPLGRADSENNPNTCTAKIMFASNPIMRKSPYAGMYFNGQGRPINVDGYANTLPASMGGNKTPFFDEEYLYGNALEDWVAEYHRGLMSGEILPKSGEAPARLRRITIKEAARIQSFPDNYIFCGNKGSVYKQIGNAVPCGLAEGVAKSIVSYLIFKG